MKLFVGYVMGLIVMIVITQWRMKDQYCYKPYGTEVITQFNAKFATVRIKWLDVERGGAAWSSFDYNVDTGITRCDIAVRKPEQVIGDPDMDSLGHEVLHCLIGDFHPEDE